MLLAHGGALGALFETLFLLVPVVIFAWLAWWSGRKRRREEAERTGAAESPAPAPAPEPPAPAPAPEPDSAPEDKGER